MTSGLVRQWDASVINFKAVLIENSRTHCKHNTDILSLYKVDMAFLFVNSC